MSFALEPGGEISSLHLQDRVVCMQNKLHVELGLGCRWWHQYRHVHVLPLRTFTRMLWSDKGLRRLSATSNVPEA